MDGCFNSGISTICVLLELSVLEEDWVNSS